MKCPNCLTNEAVQHPTFGIMYCLPCQNKHDKLPSPSLPIEIIPERIKAERKERQDSIEQPHFHGELNKRWVDLWGKEAARDRGFSDKEIKNAKYVMDKVQDGSVRYYKHET